MTINYKFILQNGITITSSGTSGSKKTFFQSPEKLKAANRIAIESQKITKSSKIYTCCKVSHAGGLLAQTLPSLEIGATVDIEHFSAYEFVKKIKNYTHTHITPLHAKAIMLTKGFKNLDLSGIRITCGADPVTWDIIEAFVSKGAIFISNWGMSEIGPIAINTTFDSLEKVVEYKNLCPSNSTILGDVAYCDYKVDNVELVVKGDICIYDTWYPTKDTVILINNKLFYTGRKNINVDLFSPRKG
jgi:acyl-CoA synthetase (AMP-forming)/AMP-acid ligase II